MNNRIAKKYRKTVGARTDMPADEKREFYRMIKRDYRRYGFLHSQNPKLKLSRRQARLALKNKAA